MHRLLIIDEYPVVRRGITRALDEAGVAVEVGEAATAADAIERLHSDRWSAVIMDMALADGGGSALLGRLCRERPDLPILIFTALPEVPYGLRALRAGACGFLHKSAPAEVLVDAVQRTLSGHRYVSPALADALAGRGAAESDEALYELLSDRELEVFRLIALGKSMVEIGHILNISPKTAHAHRANILRKTGLPNNQALSAYAFEQKLIPGRRAGDRRRRRGGNPLSRTADR